MCLHLGLSCKMLLGAKLQGRPVPLGPTFRAFIIENLWTCQLPNSGINESVSFPKAPGGRGQPKAEPCLPCMGPPCLASH